jgi:hypothetical protein
MDPRLMKPRDAGLFASQPERHPTSGNELKAAGKQPAHRSGIRPSRQLPRKPVTKTVSYPLVCAFCNGQADGIAFRTRLFEGRSSIEAPVLACEHCHEFQEAHPLMDTWSPYWSAQPGSRLCYLAIGRIQSYSKDELPRLWNRKRTELNQFREPRWTKTLWRIWYLGRKSGVVRA